MRKNSWTPDEIQFLKENANVLTSKQISEKLGRTKSATDSMFEKLGIKRQPKTKNGVVTERWTPEEIEFFKEFYPQKTNKEMEFLMCKTEAAIEKKATIFKLKKKIGMAEIEAGKKYNNLLIEDVIYDKKSYYGLCFCDCGQRIKVREYLLISNKRRSCGCLHKSSVNRGGHNKTHGEKNTRLYKIWSGIKTRCLNNKVPHYQNYGGRGISICEEWLKYENFRNWALYNGYSKGLTIDRKNNEGNYEPSNCWWVNRKHQANNRRNNVLITAFGETKTLTMWLEDDRCVVKNFFNINYRISVGWTPELAITTPVQKAKIKVRKYKFVPRTHGMCGERIYRIWRGMLRRCYNEKQINYSRYGGKGIEVCEEWHDFVNFYIWSKNNGYTDELTIDRLNNSKNYCPENCRWATKLQQARNKNSVYSPIAEDHKIQTG